MKKKWLILSGCLLVVLTGLLLFTPPVFKLSKEIIIPVPINHISPQFTDLRHWKNWFPELKDKDSTTLLFTPATSRAGATLRSGSTQYSILRSNLVSITVKEERGVGVSYHLITALPDSIASITRVKWVNWVSALPWLIEKLRPTSKLEAGLASLQDYETDPKEYYGFPISVERVVDTLVLTKKATVRKTELTSSLSSLYQELLDYGRAKNLGVSPDGPRMATFYYEAKDSLHLAVGIPVIRRAPSQDGMDFLEMPARGKMLVGQYEGPYSGLPDLYRAMRSYVADKGMKVVGAIYEKYLTMPRTASDSLHMKIELHYPVL
jgi:effector-binding domain-containing protein